MFDHEIFISNILVEGRKGPYYFKISRSSGEGDYDLRIHIGQGGLYSWKGMQYRLTGKAVPWCEAQIEALCNGGNLVTIEDQSKNDWLVKAFGGKKEYWIGFNDIDEENYWVWISGKGGDWRRTTGTGTSYINWQDLEPSFKYKEDVAIINYESAGKWADEESERFYQGIIEIPGPIQMR